MRVLICKIHWPFKCFCKPSDAAAAHLYSSGPLKLENTPPQPQRQPLPLPSASTVASLSDTSNQLSAVIETTQVKDQNSHSDGKVHVENATKSCIKNSPAAVECTKHKKVQWIDNVGKELAEIKEFESFETGDSDNEDDNKGCMCIIL